MAITHAQLVQALVADRARLLAYALSILGDEHTAEDVYQEVCTLALEKCDTIENAEHLAAWLRITSRHRALKAAAKTKRGPVALDAETLDLLDPYWRSMESVESSRMSDALRQCIQRLTPQAQQLVKMRYGQGIASGRIAEQLRRPLNTIYVAMTRIHRQLGQCVRDRLTQEAQHE